MAPLAQKRQLDWGACGSDDFELISRELTLGISLG